MLRVINTFTFCNSVYFSRRIVNLWREGCLGKASICPHNRYTFFLYGLLLMLLWFQTLKTFCWGGPNIVPRPEWIKSGVEFHPPEVTNAYGLKAIKGATKSFQLILGNISLMTRLVFLYFFVASHQTCQFYISTDTLFQRHTFWNIFSLKTNKINEQPSKIISIFQKN